MHRILTVTGSGGLVQQAICVEAPEYLGNVTAH